jgi:hypothetical protein
MKTWECLVAIPQNNGYNPIPTKMTFTAESYIQAKSYFQQFGKLLNDPRIV